jgi:hypothetical protein
MRQTWRRVAGNMGQEEEGRCDGKNRNRKTKAGRQGKKIKIPKNTGKRRRK